MIKFKPVSQKHQQKLEQIDALYSTNKIQQALTNIGGLTNK